MMGLVHWKNLVNIVILFSAWRGHHRSLCISVPKGTLCVALKMRNLAMLLSDEDNDHNKEPWPLDGMKFETLKEQHAKRNPEDLEINYEDLIASQAVDIIPYEEPDPASYDSDVLETDAGQERFRTLTSSYFKGAQGIILVYDVTRRETFTNLSDVWAKEVDLYFTNQDCVKMVVGNKVDKIGFQFVLYRFVSKEFQWKKK